MKAHLFLTGPSSADASALLRDALAPALGYAGGYTMRESFDEQGALHACTLYPAAAAADPTAWEGEMYLVISGASFFKNNEVFRESAVKMLQEAEYYPLVLLDSVGGFELLIPQFRAALSDCLQLDLPILCVLKSPAETEDERKRLGLSDRFSAIASEVRSAILEDEETELLTVLPGSESAAQEALRRWVREQLPFLATEFPE